MPENLQQTNKRGIEESEAMQIYKALHDLKAPLASMEGLISLFRSEVKDHLALSYLEMFEKCHHRLNMVVISLQQIYLYRSGEIEKKPVKVRNCIMNVLGSIRHMHEAQDIDFKIDITATDEFRTNEAMLESIIQNILHNAIIYRNKGSNSMITVCITEKNAFLELSIHDNGKGILPEALPHVFNMFYRGDTESKGSGLGLYIVKKNAELLGGGASIKSTEGAGTTVTVVLPFS